MPHLPARDRVLVAMFAAAGAAVVLVALLGRLEWAVALLGALMGSIGAIAVTLASVLRGARHERAIDRKEAQLVFEQTLALVREVGADVAAARREVENVLAATTRIDEGVSTASALAIEAVTSTRRRLVRETSGLREDVAAVALDLARQRRRLGPQLITDFQALTQLMARYAPAAPLPPVSGWALSAAGLHFITDAIERRGAELVVECGSGSSSLWMAMAMRKKGTGKVIALEHQEDYAERTRVVLELHGVTEWAEVRLAPLVPVETPRGSFAWYDVDPTSLPSGIDLLLVDGPPGTTGRHARYPALPILSSHLAEKSMIVVDDAERRDERDILEYWMTELPALVQTPSPERGIVVLERVS